MTLRQNLTQYNLISFPLTLIWCVTISFSSLITDTWEALFMKPLYLSKTEVLKGSYLQQWYLRKLYRSGKPFISHNHCLSKHWTQHVTSATAKEWFPCGMGIFPLYGNTHRCIEGKWGHDISTTFGDTAVQIDYRTINRDVCYLKAIRKHYHCYRKKHTHTHTLSLWIFLGLILHIVENLITQSQQDRWLTKYWSYQQFCSFS